MVIGHHPHIVQPVVKYKDGYIAYSLGNFVFDQDFSEETMRGLLLEVRVAGGKILDIVSRKVLLNSQFQPEFVK